MTTTKNIENFALVIAFPTRPDIVRWFGSLAAAQAAQRNHARGSASQAYYVIVSEEEFTAD